MENNEGKASEILGKIYSLWEKEWKEAKGERVARLHNRLIEIIVEEKAHIDEIILALEILLQETLDAKLKIIQEQTRSAVKLSDNQPASVT